MRKNRGVVLAEYVKRRGGAKYKVLKRIYDNIQDGKLRLRDPNPPRDFLEYFMRLDYSLWAWTILIILVLTLASIAFSDIISLLRYLRYIFGLITILFLPGYVLIETLYPRERDLKPIERLALSIGLSLAILPLIGIILNYTPWGIRLEPIITSITIYIFVLTIVASYRKYIELRHL